MPNDLSTSSAGSWDAHMSDGLKTDVACNAAVICTTEPGNPVVFVSDAFEAHTGYAPADVVGRSLAMLQGKGTEPEAVQLFRDLINSAKPGKIRITNYRKDGTEFLHECELRPIFDADGTVTHFAAIQRPV